MTRWKGTGDDTYVLTIGDTDTITEVGGQGVDTIITYHSYTLGANLENLAFLGNNVVNGTGNELANVITGNAQSNLLSGLSGNDTLNAGGGEDTLDGGVGNDVMRGGAGNDSYYVNSVADKVAESANEGQYDKVVTTLAAYVLGANVERLTFNIGTAAAVGTGNALDNAIEGADGNDKLVGQAGLDSLRGNAGDDTLTGGTGNDVLDGGTGKDVLNGGAGNDSLYGREGADVMIGGAGNDSYHVDSTDDVVEELANGGIDIIWTSVSMDLAANIENAALEEDLTVNGNDLNNTIYGSSGNEAIAGGKGADMLIGGDGNDKLGGDDGNDVIDGGLGVDTINGGAGNDLFRYVLDDPNELSELGDDVITGFEAGKDKIDLYDLFVDFEIEREDVVGDGFLRLEVNGGNTLLQFDKNGGADSFVTLATLQGVTNVTLADIIYHQGGVSA
jgi:Ca2+-binding RTX toxin-like protein